MSVFDDIMKEQAAQEAAENAEVERTWIQLLNASKKQLTYR